MRTGGQEGWWKWGGAPEGGTVRFIELEPRCKNEGGTSYLRVSRMRCGGTSSFEVLTLKCKGDNGEFSGEDRVSIFGVRREV